MCQVEKAITEKNCALNVHLPEKAVKILSFPRLCCVFVLRQEPINKSNGLLFCGSYLRDWNDVGKERENKRQTIPTDIL